MGMFDTIMGDGLTCKKCGVRLRDLQSKDGPCCLDVYPTPADFLEQVNRRHVLIYTDCEACGHWNEFRYGSSSSKS